MKKEVTKPLSDSRVIMRITWVSILLKSVFTPLTNFKN